MMQACIPLWLSPFALSVLGCSGPCYSLYFRPPKAPLKGFISSSIWHGVTHYSLFSCRAALSPAGSSFSSRVFSFAFTHQTNALRLTPRNPTGFLPLNTPYSSAIAAFSVFWVRYIMGLCASHFGQIRVIRLIRALSGIPTPRWYSDFRMGPIATPLYTLPQFL